MNIAEALEREHSKVQTLKITSYIGDDTKRFDQLMGIVLGDDQLLTQRGAWVMSHCTDLCPQLITPYIPQLVDELRKETHIALRRNILRILQNNRIEDEEVVGNLVDICFDILTNNNEEIAVKVFAMTVLFNHIKDIPELTAELKIIIQDQLPYASAGFKSRAKKIMRYL